MKKLPVVIALVALLGGVYLYSQPGHMPAMDTNTALAQQFAKLSTQGNSACSEEFNGSIDMMAMGERIQGSCCSPMDFHHYSEQVEALKKFKDIPEIPADPYDIDAKLAQEMKAYYDFQLTPEEQKEYDYAMENSNEKGPCCCKCWHWYVYGGIGKYLIHNYGFTGAQVAEVWDLSDGCGGAAGHAHGSDAPMDHMMHE